MGVKRFGAVLERYAHAALEAPGDDATIVIDGNNLAHHVAAGAATYDAIDERARAFLRSLGRRPVVAFFDGPREAGAGGARDGELGARADARGDAAARRIYEGVDARSRGVLSDG